jgi:predicted Holliday junction resolvase-like endonuclease
MEVAVAVIITAVIAILFFLLYNYILRLKYEGRLRRWQETEIDKVRKEAISQSRAVLGGKFTEQMVPYLPDFKYDPTEARFIGSPIDLIVFPGLAAGDPKEIVIIEVKTGNSQLTPPERKIRELVENSMVRWEIIQR